MGVTWNVNVDLGSVADWIAAVTGLISAGILVFTVVYARRTVTYAKGALDDAQRTRHSQLIIALNDQWSSPEILKSRELYWRYPPDKIKELIQKVHGDEATATKAEQEDYEVLSATPSLVETIAVLRSDGAITTEVVYRMWGGDILSIWLYWKEAVPLLQHLMREPDVLRGFEVLSENIQTMFTDRARERLEPSEADDESRAEGEVEP
jgi:hypothetical protein